MGPQGMERGAYGCFSMGGNEPPLRVWSISTALPRPLTLRHRRVGLVEVVDDRRLEHNGQRVRVGFLCGRVKDARWGGAGGDAT